MFSLETIKYMNREQAKKARGKKPYVVTEKDTFPPFPFPNFGDYRPKGWKLTRELFCDKTGMGTASEPALTVEHLIRELKIGYGYAIIEEGQFQLYIGEFEKEKK